MTAPPISITAIIGTRPEAIKLAPVILAARQRPAQFTVRVIRTGQHRELVDDLMNEFGISADVDLKIMQRDQNLTHVMAESVRGVSAALAAHGADWVLVQGDTTSTFGYHSKVSPGKYDAQRAPCLGSRPSSCFRHISCQRL